MDPPNRLLMQPARGPCPKVSVLVPNFNYARFLPESIGSVLEQDFTDFELLVSDDASTDGSLAIIEEFARRDARIRFARQPTNLGLVGNFNWCLAQARGEFVKFLLADDKLARPDSLRRLLAMLEQGPEVVLVSSSAQIIDEDSRFQRVRDYLGRDLNEDGRSTCRRCLLSGQNQIGEPSLYMFRRRCAGSGFNPDYRLWVDLEFALRVLEQGRFAYCAETLAAFRIHPAQATRPLLEQELLQIEYWKLLADFAERPWLGRAAARDRLFEELYQIRKRGNTSPALEQALREALERVGGTDSYEWFKLRRKLVRPLTKLRRFLWVSAQKKHGISSA